MVTEPEATAQWMEIFHAVVIAVSTATLRSMHPMYPDNSGGAPSATSSTRPAATDVVMNESTTSLARLVPTFLSFQRPRRTPRVMNSVGSTAAKKAASSPQPSPATPSACQPIAMTVAMIQFFGSSRYVTRRATDSRVTGPSRKKATTCRPCWQVVSVRTRVAVRERAELRSVHARTHRRGVPGTAGQDPDARGDPGRDASRRDGVPPRVPQRGAELRRTVRHAARSGLPGRADLPVAVDRSPGGDVIPDPADRRRPDQAAPGVQAVGRPELRHAGPYRRLPEQRADGTRLRRRLVRPDRRRLFPQCRRLLPEGPRGKPALHAHPHPAAGQPRARGQPAGRGSADGARRTRGRQRHRGARRADARHHRPVRR